MAQRIEDYALIGDTQTAALVGRNGSIDWLCVPRFDSGAVLRGAARRSDQRAVADRPGGRAPAHRAHVPRRHARARDDVPHRRRRREGHRLHADPGPDRRRVRLVEGVEGRVPMHMDLTIRFDYGSIVPWVSDGDGRIHAVAGPDAVVLETPVRTHGAGKATVADFVVEAGDKVPFSLAYHPSHEDSPRLAACERAIKETARWWRTWAKQCTYDGDWKPQVMRSLITLKALTYAPTGGIVAAPDHVAARVARRACGTGTTATAGCATQRSPWWRSPSAATPTRRSPGATGCCAPSAGDPEDLQIMYGAAGERRLTEFTVDWLDGYEGSTPGAHRQRGERAVPARRLRRGARRRSTAPASSCPTAARTRTRGRSSARCSSALEGLWRHPDDGIWEVRGPRQHFTHSKVMAWVAFDRAVQNCRASSSSHGPVERWQADPRRDPRRRSATEGFDPEIERVHPGLRVEAHRRGGADDAADRLPPRRRPADHGHRRGHRAPSAEGRLRRRATRRRPDGAVDGLPAGEGAFLPCSFWLADNLALIGRVDDARRAVRAPPRPRATTSACSPRSTTAGAERQLGNFPQAFTHVSLVNTAAHLSSETPTAIV